MTDACPPTKKSIRTVRNRSQMILRVQNILYNGNLSGIFGHSIVFAMFTCIIHEFTSVTNYFTNDTFRPILTYFCNTERMSQLHVFSELFEQVGSDVRALVKLLCQYDHFTMTISKV
mmetsp:Transcript_17534/g.26080  ORF Transcript_17534/g.26080 Transcript_17534/m.26080 type:complete len:117 (+) Transcript_17534:247-597(+)